MPPKETTPESIPDGSGTRLGMFSARFDGGQVEARIREVHRILEAHNYNVLMVSASAGQDFGRDTMRFLGRLLTEKGVLLAVCSPAYAEMTSSSYSSYEELKMAHDNKLPIVPLRMSDTYPPRPPYGPQHDFDKQGEAIGLVSMAISHSTMYIDCRQLTPHHIAARIAETLREVFSQGRECAGQAVIGLVQASHGYSGEAPAASAPQVTGACLQELEGEAVELDLALKELAGDLGETAEEVQELLEVRNAQLRKVQELLQQLNQSGEKRIAVVKAKNSLKKLKARIESMEEYIILEDKVVRRSEAEAKMKAQEEEKKKIQKAATSSAVPSASAMPMSAAASSSQAAGGGYTAPGASQVPTAGASKASPGTLAGPSQASPALQQAIQKALAALAAKNVLAVAAALGEAVGFELSDAPELNDAKAFLLAEQARKISEGHMPMLEAASQGNTDAVRGLISAKCNKDARRNDGSTALHLAAARNCVEIVTLLLEARADQEAQDQNGWTPLHDAAFNDSVEIVTLLLEARADKAATNKYGQTALHLAAEKGHVDIARCLLEAGVDKDARDRYCFTPLHWAAFNDSVEIVTLLLEARADQEATENGGGTPLKVALHYDKLAAAAALRAAGAREPS